MLRHRLARLPAHDRGGCQVKQSNDVSGLQLLFSGLVAIALMLHVVGVFVLRLREQRNALKAIDQDDQQ
jgi:hypothetical protein